jgi:hypothetical protein
MLITTRRIDIKKTILLFDLLLFFVIDLFSFLRVPDEHKSYDILSERILELLCTAIDVPY